MERDRSATLAVTRDMIAVGIAVLDDSGILPWGVSADEPIVVTEIFLAMLEKSSLLRQKRQGLPQAGRKDF
jgi:hypothetical protein